MRLGDLDALAKDLELLAKYEDPCRESVILGVVHKVESFPSIDPEDLRPKAHWEPIPIYTFNYAEKYQQKHNGWKCSRCGWTTYEQKFDFCTCGADMREGNKD